MTAQEARMMSWEKREFLKIVKAIVKAIEAGKDHINIGKPGDDVMKFLEKKGYQLTSIVNDDYECRVQSYELRW